MWTRPALYKTRPALYRHVPAFLLHRLHWGPAHLGPTGGEVEQQHAAWLPAHGPALLGLDNHHLGNLRRLLRSVNNC